MYSRTLSSTRSVPLSRRAFQRPSGRIPREPERGNAARLLKTKLRLVADRLERSLGRPVQPRRLTPPLDVLIATVLSQHTNDRNSRRAYVSLRRTFSTWESVGLASRQEIASAIRAGGMARQKARTILQILRTVKERHGVYSLSALKRESNEYVMEQLMGLNGVGVKTAACVLLFGMGRDLFPVDVHVHRVCRRMGLVPSTASAEATFEAVSPLVPAGRSYSLHTNLIRFGRSVCRPQDPKCSVCPLYDQCVFEGRTNAHAARS